jgi:CheY-like chemotaxis protein
MLTVLVADDEFAVLELVAMALEAEGHRVLRAGDGADALRILYAQPCDIVVTDEVMPVMSGRSLVAAMRAAPRLADIPAILLVETYGRPAPEVEGATVLAKPVKLAELAQVVERAGAAKSRRTP